MKILKSHYLRKLETNKIDFTDIPSKYRENVYFNSSDYKELQNIYIKFETIRFKILKSSCIIDNEVLKFSNYLKNINPLLSKIIIDSYDILNTATNKQLPFNLGFQLKVQSIYFKYSAFADLITKLFLDFKELKANPNIVSSEILNSLIELNNINLEIVDFLKIDTTDYSNDLEIIQFKFNLK